MRFALRARVVDPRRTFATIDALTAIGREAGSRLIVFARFLARTNVPSRTRSSGDASVCLLDAFILTL